MALANSPHGARVNAFFAISSDNRLTAQPASITGKPRTGRGRAVIDSRYGNGGSRNVPNRAIISWSEGQSHGVAAMPVADFTNTWLMELSPLRTNPRCPVDRLS
jgi:hypothetical protein